MSTQRPHIHLICDINDISLHDVQDALTIFCETKAHLSRDLFTVTNNTANYSWRCINACDYVLMLIGESYGKLNNSGVSQLHISYLNARTKNKPMAILIGGAPARPRQLGDLVNAISEQNKHIYHFDQHSNLDELFGRIFDAFGDSIVAKPTFMDTSSVIGTPTISHEPQLSRYEHSLVHNIKPNLNLQDEVLMNCTAHAFKGGTLIEVAFIASSTWQAILSTLVNTSMSFSLQGLWRILNDLVADQAMPAVKSTHPEVHAISRCQITKADVIWIQEELLAAGWISRSSNNITGKETWRTTDQARHSLGKL